ncbi:hypothetical protein SBV1_1930002 [Verrucomicrobia bacterium]|nr:hypothetical protein SBV1_1930002 [Verrucomicrobiota bacterium]
MVPSNEKQEPTMPGAEALGPPSRLPSLVLIRSLAFPSPGHHPTNPDGGGTQLVGSAPAFHSPIAEHIIPTAKAKLNCSRKFRRRRAPSIAPPMLPKYP